MKKSRIQKAARGVKGLLAGGAMVTAIIASVFQAKAIELPVFSTNLPPVDFHGFASQGFIWNSGNADYLGGNSSEGTFQFREYGVNGTIAYKDFRIGAQIFAQDLGPYGNDKPQLDWGMVDYHPFQWFGISGGRVKMPRGLYNETLDLDATRAFVLLPQSVYDARLRDFNSAVNGGEIYGNIEVPHAGSFDYKVFGGAMPISMDSGVVDYFNTGKLAKTYDMSVDDCYGGTIFWNPPLITGLRIGYSANVIDGLKVDRQAKSLGRYVKHAEPILRQLGSIEYVRGNWTFAGEIGAESATYSFTSKRIGGSRKWDADTMMGYVSATRRMNRWLELGSYYSFFQTVEQTFPTRTQHDVALVARFDLTDYLIFKIEGHYLNGAGKVFDTTSHPQPLKSLDQDWLMLDAKITFSF